MQLLKILGIINESDDKTNICHSFCVPETVKKLTVSYSYSPKTVENKSLAEQKIAQAMEKYKINFADPDAFFPVKNLVTLSFDENGQYRGACHRQPNEQTVIIASADSTPGIINREIQSGSWSVVLNVHFAGCEIKYNLEIEGEEE